MGSFGLGLGFRSSTPTTTSASSAKRGFLGGFDVKNQILSRAGSSTEVIFLDLQFKNSNWLILALKDNYLLNETN